MSSISFSKKIALRYLWTKRSEAFISVITIISILGVAIGVMVLNIVMAVMTGFESELRDKIIGTDSHIVVQKLGGKISQWEDIDAKIAGVSGVDTVSAFTYQQALIRNGNSSTGVLIRGIPNLSPASLQLSKYLESGQDISALFSPPQLEIQGTTGFADSTNLPGIIIGKELARSLGIFVGTPISLLSPQVASSPFGLIPKYRRFLVVGTYNSGLVGYESSLAYISLPEAQNFFRLGKTVNGFEVRVKDINKSLSISEEIMHALGDLSKGFYTKDWTETNKPLWDAIRLEKKVYFIVLLLIIIMASFSIISTLIMIVLEKRKDIAILRTMGAPTKSIARIFRIQGAVIGGVGTLLGLFLGYAGCLILKTYGFPLDEKIFQMSTLPIKIELVNFLAVGVAAFFICFISTLYPARRACSLDPSTVLRYE